MTDTKPTPKEQIAFIEPFITGIPHGEMFKSILASLKRLQAIDAQPVPVEPVGLTILRHRGFFGETSINEVIAYIDSLQSALQVAQNNYQFMVNKAADKYLPRYRELGEICANLEQRAEKAESELAALRLELAQLNGEIPYGN